VQYGDFTVQLHRCRACEQVVQLERWQLRQMPWSYGRCRQGGKRLTLIETFTLLCDGEQALSVDCYESGVPLH
jgi:hypothetical protein